MIHHHPGLPMIAHRLSQCLALSLAALTWWVTVSLPGVVDPDFTVEIYLAFALTVAVLFGLLFFVLRFVTAGSDSYWSADAGAKQVRRIGLMIAATLALQLAAGRVLDLFGLSDPVSLNAIYLMAWPWCRRPFCSSGLLLGRHAYVLR